MEVRRTRDITDRTAEISSPLPALPSLSPSALHPWATISRGDYSGEEKAPERRLRVATDITVTHTRSRSRILSGISSKSRIDDGGLCRDACRRSSVKERERERSESGRRERRDGRCASETERLASLVINKCFARTLIARVMERE